MKITFNPTIKNHKTYFKPLKSNVLQGQEQTNLNRFDCVMSYNLSFGARAIYAISYDGNYERFDSASQAKYATSAAIGSVLSGKCAVTNNKTFVYADDVELPNGEIDTNAIYNALLCFQKGQNQPIYAIDFFGNIQRFDTRKQASEKLGMYLGNINQILNQSLETLNGYTFIKAFDIELRDKNGKLLKDENNDPILDIETINKLRERFLYTGRDFPIVSIDKNGDIIQYQNINEAAFKTKNRRANIAQSIVSEKTTQGKYAFARLSDVVKVDRFGDVVYDENNDFVLDYNKVEKIRKTAFKK